MCCDVSCSPVTFPLLSSTGSAIKPWLTGVALDRVVDLDLDEDEPTTAERRGDGGREGDCDCNGVGRGVASVGIRARRELL